MAEQIKKLPELSVFFPFWNEEENIESVVKKAIPVAKEVASKWEIIMVNDGSSDKTLQKAQELEKTLPNVKLISYYPNRGYGAALRAGLTQAKYDYVVFTDGDGQFDFAEVTNFIDAIKKADIVVGYRKKRQDTKIYIRLLLMYLLKIWDYLFFRINVHDIDCGFKMFRRHALDEIMPLRSEGAMITTEILARAYQKKLTIAQVGVTHYARAHGVQSGANFQVVMRAVFESLILWWDIKNRRF